MDPNKELEELNMKLQSMRNKRILKAIEAYKQKHMESKEAARIALDAAGVLDEDGNLKPYFR